ncbi:MAG: hypothetical protein KKA73_04210 [Chloroflexi bacterium]|nr:hypothetical protein [Chloroflexota bacterium]MBU1746870.1 hypothetical protein [Chloroflexota bacterium]MBU1878907.1 hypothetical protein [Chloroflexota bacterium]
MLVYDVQDLVKTYPGQARPANDSISLQIQRMALVAVFWLVGRRLDWRQR